MAFDVLSFVMGQQAGKASGGGSSGGGGLPAGLYFSQADLVFPSGISYYYYFIFENKLHCMGLTSTTETYNLYEINGNEFIEKATGLNIRRVGSGPMEYNGKIHFLGGGGYRNHYVFDGTTLKTLRDLPDAPSKGDVFIHNGKIMYLYGAMRKVKEWDEATDSWSEVSFDTSALGNIIPRMFYANEEEIYLIDSINNRLFKSINNVFTQIGQFVEKSAYYGPKYLNGFVYHLKSSSGEAIDIYKYNLATNEDILIGKVPYLGSADSFVWENRIHFFNRKTNMTMYELT